MTNEVRTFENSIDIINKIIYSKRNEWNMLSLTHIDFDDVAQVLRCHIDTKWYQYDQTRPLENWISTIVSNRIKNLKRDHYGKIAPPCSQCVFNTGEYNGCSFTESGLRDATCPKYAKWIKCKKAAYEITFAANLDDLNSITPTSIGFNIEKSIDSFHQKMAEILPPRQLLAYKYLFIDNLTDEQVAEKLGFRSSEGRSPGYKQLANIRNKLLAVARRVIADFDIIY